MENTLTQITNYLATQSWQIAVLAAAIAVVSLLLKNKSAHVRYLLWLIVLAKCLTPPLLTIPLAVLPQQQVPQPAAMAPAEIAPLSIEPVRPVIYERPGALAPAPPVIERVSFGQRLSGFAVRQWLPLTWIGGFALFLSITLIKALRTNSWLRRARRPLPAGLKTAIDNLFGDLGIRTFPKVWLVKDIGQPFVWGLLRGGIYLPANFAKLDSDRHRRGILGHELSHVLRFDAAVNLLQIIVQAVFWFHPFVWWANKKIRAEREKCCDEMAIARLNAKAKDYSTAIVNTLIAEHKSAKPIPSLAVAGPVKNIEDRIKTILNPNKKFYKQPTFLVIAAVALAAATTVPTTLALTSRPPDKADARNEEQQKHFIAKLPNGVTVELVGVCDHPSEGKQWWRPDGSHLDMSILTEDKSLYTSDHPGYDIAFKFSGQDFSVRFKDIKGCEQQSALDVLEPEGIHVMRAHIKPQISKTRMKVGVAAGKWETVGSHTGHGTAVKMIKRFLSRKKIIFSAANETKDGLVMTVSDDLDWHWNKDTALFAVEKNGVEHKGKILTSLFAVNMQQQTFKFSDVLLKDIKEFQLRTRPYEWTELKNISLKPNFNTDLQVESDEGQHSKRISDHTKEQQKQFIAKLPNGVTVELVGVCEHPSGGKQWWRPDGVSLGEEVYVEKKGSETDDGRYGFVVKVDGPEDLSFSWAGFEGSGGWWGSCDVFEARVGKLEGFEASIARMAQDKTTTTIRIGIAASPWKTVVTHHGKGMSMKEGIAFASAYQSNGATRIVVTDSLGNELVQRVVAIDNSGNTHPSRGSSGSVSNQNLRQTTANFPDLKLNRVKEFQFQTRPYECVEFKNVSLRPGLKTHVQVEHNGKRVQEIEGLVGYWKLDGNANDSTGKNHGIVNGATLTDGISGQAYYFDGKDDYIQTPLSVEQSGSQSITMSAWVYPTTIGGIRHQVISTDDGGHDWSIFSQGGKWQVFTGEYSWNSGLNVEVNKWQHIAAVFKPGANLVFYKNALSKSRGAAPATDVGTHNACIGANPGPWEEYFQGKIDEVAIYQRALSADEIYHIYGRFQQLAHSQPATKTDVQVKPAKMAQTENLVKVSQNPIGKWRSVDFVRRIEDFKPGIRSFSGELFLKDVEFNKGGKTSSSFTWRRGWIRHEDGRTKARYQIKKINGTTYLFLPWLSGDVTIRGQKPRYYVMEKVEQKTSHKQREQIAQQAGPTVLAGEFVELLVKGNFSAATKNFDATMRQAMPPERLADVWKGLVGQSGVFKEQIGTRTEKTPGFDIVYVTCEFEKGPLDIKVVYDSKRQVSGLWFVPVPQHVLEGYQNKQAKAPIQRKPSNEAVYKQLEQIFNLSELPPQMHFADALDVIKNSVEPPLNVFVFWNDLYNEADVDRTSPINIDSAAKVPLNMAFSLLLDSVSGGFADLTYTVANGLIYIGPKKVLRKKVKTSVHRISDVLGADNILRSLQLQTIHAIDLQSNSVAPAHRAKVAHPA